MPTAPRVPNGTSRSLGTMVTAALTFPDVITATEGMGNQLKAGAQKDFYLILADARYLSLVTQGYGGIVHRPLDTSINVFTDDGFLREHSSRVCNVQEALGDPDFIRRPTTNCLFNWATSHDDGACRHGNGDGIESTAVSVISLNARRQRWTFRHRQGRPCSSVSGVHLASLKIRANKP